MPARLMSLDVLRELLMPRAERASPGPIATPNAGCPATRGDGRVRSETTRPSG